MRDSVVVRTGQRDPVARLDERFLNEVAILDLVPQREWPPEATQEQRLQLDAPGLPPRAP